MADEIEKYLVTKLNQAIEKAEESEKHLPAKLAQLPSKFRHLKKSLAAPNHPTNLREKLYTLDNLLSEWQIQSEKNTPYSLESLYSVFKFAKNLDKIRGELHVVGGSHVTPSTGGARDISTSHEPISGVEMGAFRWSERSVDETKVHGIHEKTLSLQRLLVLRNDKDDRRFNVIAIVGKQGIGKTTLTQLVFNNPEVKKHFLPRIWVCASKQPEDDSDNQKKIVKRMLTCLGVEQEIIESAGDKHGLKGLLFALRLQLRGKRYLIVLDDVWSDEGKYEDFCSFCSSLDKDENKCCEKLAYGLPKGFGGAVIVTSRVEELVADMVGEKNLHRVMPLEDPESCWKIFVDSAGQIDTQLEGLKGDIIEKCAGLPLAAKMMGQIAREPPPENPAAPEIQSP